MPLIDLPSLVLAQAAPAGSSESSLLSFLPIVLMFVVLYFLMIRPQMKRQKEHKAMVSNLSKGDEVVTAGGVLGKITQVDDTYVTLDISSTTTPTPVEIRVQRSAITSVLLKGTIKTL